MYRRLLAVLIVWVIFAPVILFMWIDGHDMWRWVVILATVIAGLTALATREES